MSEPGHVPFRDDDRELKDGQQHRIHIDDIELTTVANTPGPIDGQPNAKRTEPSTRTQRDNVPLVHYQPSYPTHSSATHTDNDWEDRDDVREANGRRCRDLRERLVLVFLILIGLTCLSLSIYRFKLNELSSAFALLIVGILTLIPGIYYAVKMYRLRGTNISVFDQA